MATLTMTDVELAEALRTDHPAALGRLYDRYGGLVYGLSLAMLSHPQEAEDLTQEVFLTVWRSQNYDPNRGSLSSYLTTLTRSRAIDRLRSRSSYSRHLQRWAQILSPSTSAPLTDHLLAQERHERVRQALDLLPPNQRRVLELSYFKGLTQTEIAQQLNTPLGTVKAWSRRGLLSLRKHLHDLTEVRS